MPFLEICVDGASGVRAALDGGSDRVELCSALEVGGLTPSPGLVSFAVALGIPARALIRPRAGNFVFNDDEECVMHQDITGMVALGIEGVVLGASHLDGRLNVDLLQRLVATAREAGARGLTLHRAIDLTPNLEEAVDEAARLGFDTVLSSGGALTAPEGASMLSRMHHRAPTSLTIMAGSGVTPLTVGTLVAATGVTAVHASARSRVHAADPKLVAFGFAKAGEQSADAATVRAIRNALDARGPAC